MGSDAKRKAKEEWGVYLCVCVYTLLLGCLLQRHTISGAVVKNAKSPSERMECKISKHLSINEI